jgi:DNA-binding NarL/FixJ family response regulator
MDVSSVATPTPRTVRRLLIVAGNSLIVEAIRIGFRRSSEFNLIGHVDAYRACARVILDAQPDVLLLDDMDGHDRGLELISEISQENEHISVIVLSVRMNGERLTRLFDAGATAVISKATPPGALATMVRETLNGHIVHKLGSNGAQVGLSSALASAQDSPLTGRELEILQLVAGGCTNADVARRLWVTEQTVKFHLRNIYRKLGVANRTQASHFAHVNGLVDLRPAVSAARQPEIAAVAS